MGKTKKCRDTKVNIYYNQIQLITRDEKSKLEKDDSFQKLLNSKKTELVFQHQSDLQIKLEQQKKQFLINFDKEISDIEEKFKKDVKYCKKAPYQNEIAQFIFELNKVEMSKYHNETLKYSQLYNNDKIYSARKYYIQTIKDLKNNIGSFISNGNDSLIKYNILLNLYENRTYKEFIDLKKLVNRAQLVLTQGIKHDFINKIEELKYDSIKTLMNSIISYVDGRYISRDPYTNKVYVSAPKPSSYKHTTSFLTKNNYTDELSVYYTRFSNLIKLFAVNEDVFFRSASSIDLRILYNALKDNLSRLMTENDESKESDILTPIDIALFNNNSSELEKAIFELNTKNMSILKITALFNKLCFAQGFHKLREKYDDIPYDSMIDKIMVPVFYSKNVQKVGDYKFITSCNDEIEHNYTADVKLVELKNCIQVYQTLDEPKKIVLYIIDFGDGNRNSKTTSYFLDKICNLKANKDKVIITIGSGDNNLNIYDLPELIKHIKTLFPLLEESFVHIKRHGSKNKADLDDVIKEIFNEEKPLSKNILMDINSCYGGQYDHTKLPNINGSGFLNYKWYLTTPSSNSEVSYSQDVNDLQIIKFIEEHSNGYNIFDYLQLIEKNTVNTQARIAYIENGLKHDQMLLRQYIDLRMEEMYNEFLSGVADLFTLDN